jgi:hypothetical protein
MTIIIAVATVADITMSVTMAKPCAQPPLQRAHGVNNDESGSMLEWDGHRFFIVMGRKSRDFFKWSHSSWQASVAQGCGEYEMGERRHPST